MFMFLKILKKNALFSCIYQRKAVPLRRQRSMAMKGIRWIVVLWASLMLSPMMAQTSALVVGLRGGATILDVGGTGMVDLRYAWYGDLIGGCHLGLAVGAGIGYGQINFKGSESLAYSRTDYLGNTIDYSIDADYKQANRFASAEVSLLAAFRVCGFTLNIGPRFMLPFGCSAKQTITRAEIVAYYPLYDVSIPNEEITGKLATPYSQSCTSVLPKYNLLLAAEAGWEFALSGNHSLGVQAYADIGLWSPKTTITDVPTFINVYPIEAVNTPAEVSVSAAPIDPKRYIAVGLRVYYKFQLSSNRSRRIYTGDTKAHHNRYLNR